MWRVEQGIGYAPFISCSWVLLFGSGLQLQAEELFLPLGGPGDDALGKSNKTPLSRHLYTLQSDIAATKQARSSVKKCDN